MGWDAFGRRRAIRGEDRTHPRETTEKNIGNFRRQIQSLGFSYDWSREINTTDPAYYKWTSGFSSSSIRRPRLHLARPGWYCPELGTTLANEKFSRRRKAPFRTGQPSRRAPPAPPVDAAHYRLCDRLLKDLDLLDWPESLKEMQRNWIGRSEGAEVHFPISSPSSFSLPPSTLITVFTTRPDTLFGATYMVLSPEHPLVDQLTTPGQREAVQKYKAEVANRATSNGPTSPRARPASSPRPCGQSGQRRKVPIWIADYVLMGYGTGAIMAVPAHDERDHEFAVKYDLPIIEVVESLQSAAGLRTDDFALRLSPAKAMPSTPVSSTACHRRGQGENDRLARKGRQRRSPRPI